MTNGRGRSVRIDSPAVDWVGVTIIEHPAPPWNVPFTAQPGATPVIALLRRDWEFVLTDLSPAAERRFGPHLPRWSSQRNDFADRPLVCGPLETSSATVDPPEPACPSHSSICGPLSHQPLTQINRCEKARPVQKMTSPR